MKRAVFPLVAIAATFALQSFALQAAGTSPKSRLTRPIELGVSGGSTIDKANGYCCSGTLGSLVKDSSGNFYILSNTHVFAGVSGGNGKKAQVGDPINQPGFIDVNCQNRQADYVANLSKWITIVPNGKTSVDASIAKVKAGMVRRDGKILGIGTISSTPISAAVNQKVKKSGRTSGVTTGTVTGLNATIKVEYTKECAGSPYTTTFDRQIVITPGSFLQGGDSGSLMVENKSTNPRPVGLCFAGSSQIALANPIQSVLSALNVSMVGVAAEEAKATKVDKEIAKLQAIQEKHAEELLAIDGVVGHAIGVSQSDPNKQVVLVFVETKNDEVAVNIPEELDGVAVELLEVGKIVAY